ncbi:carbohydrate ABC transporter permease [Martelella mediterranea]|uniref:carbohydrate ABC transporter permease n=1 Tax=Martelella mediterranea TaxID=293089 RepID=UPI001E3CC4F5|nr:carbohydrate ABC transporter permease [Martelella mediterranea]
MVRLISRIASTLVLAAVIIITVLPILWTLLGSFKTMRDITSRVPKFIFSPTLEHFVGVLNTPAVQSGIVNSVVIVGSALIVGAVLGIPAAYVIARYDPPGKNHMQFFVLSLRFLPPVAISIPLMAIFIDVGLYDTALAVIIVYSLITTSTIIWLSVPAFQQVPPELSEAALLDGYSDGQVFLKVVLPVAAPSLVGGILFSFIVCWNELLIALTLTSRNSTLPVVAASFSSLGMEVPWGLINASAILLALPPLLLLGGILNFMNRLLRRIAD